MAIALDVATDGGLVSPGTSLTWSHTCSGADRILWVFAQVEGGAAATGVTYNGVAMTKSAGHTLLGRDMSLWFLVGPASGAHNVVVTPNGTASVYGLSASYTGAKQTDQPDNAGSGEGETGATPAISITTVADESWSVCAWANLEGANGSAGTGSALRATNSGWGGYRLFDSGAAISPAGSHTMNFTNGPASIDAGMVISSFSPVGGPPPAPGIDDVTPTETFLDGLSITASGGVFDASGNEVWVSPADDIDDAGAVQQTVTSEDVSDVTFTAVRGSLALNTNLYLFVKRTSDSESNASGFVVQFSTTTTVSFPAGNGDGHVISALNVSWDTVHDATSGTKSDSATTTSLRASLSAGDYQVGRCFFPIAIPLTLPTGVTITAATFNAYAVSKTNDDNDGDDFVAVVGPTTQASTSSLADGDLDQCGAIDNPTELSERIDIGSIGTTAHTPWALNAAGLSAVTSALGGILQLGLREGHDILDHAPVAASALTVVASEYAIDVTQRPYLGLTLQLGLSRGVVNGGVVNRGLVNGGGRVN